MLNLNNQGVVMSSLKKTYNEHIEHIRKAHEENRLAIFIGAGFSKCVDDRYPSWKKIINELIEAMPDIGETDNLKVAEHYKLEYGEIETKKKIQSYFPEKDKASDLHKELINLYPHYIITTNWDNILESTLEETSAVYSIIAEDSDLPISTDDVKIIKMHGDFDHNNYVFTESDYLNYSYNFPIIEAYLKGIIATHTIVFLGYGFGDIDLKLIMTWMKNNSSKNRNRYMLVNASKFNLYSEKYYSEYNIILLPKDSTKEYLDTEDYKEFINRINSEKTIYDDISAMEYFYNKLRPFKNLNFILFSQVKALFEPCELRLYDNKRILHFHDNVATYEDKTKEKRKHKEFYDEFLKVCKPCKETEEPIFYSEIQENIIKILSKANIEGIYFGDSFQPKDYILFSNKYKTEIMTFEKLLSFDYNIARLYPFDEVRQLLYQCNCLYNLHEYEEAFELCERLIKILLKSRELDYYFIVLWNYNTILKKLKYGFRTNRKNGQKISLGNENPYQNLEFKDIDKEYNRLPTPLRNRYKEIYRVLGNKWIFSTLAKSYNMLHELRERFENVQRGGFYGSNLAPIDYVTHASLTLFIFENFILMEDYNEFKKTHINFIEASFMRGIQNNKKTVYLSYIEIYSLIKYYKNKAFSAYLEKYYQDFLNETMSFVLEDEQQKWIVERVLKNCINYCRKATDVQVSATFTEYISNILTLLKYVKLDSEMLSTVINELLELIYNARNQITLFSIINSFFTIQYNLFYHNSEKSFPSQDAINIYKALLQKFIANNNNLYELEAIRSNSLSSIISISLVTKYSFDDITLIKRFIQKLKDMGKEEKKFLNNGHIDNFETSKQVSIEIELSLMVLLSLYQIGKDDCRKIIKEYILTQEELKEKEPNKYTLIEYKLWLTYNNIYSFEKDELKNILIYFEGKKQENSFDSRIYSLLVPLKAIKSEHEKGSEIINYEQFNSLLEILNGIIISYEEYRKKIPSFI